MPVITAIIPVWNRAAIIAQAISSVFAQELPARDWSLNVIVVDDGSSDDLAQALDHAGGPVKCVRHDRNRGAAAARNTGVTAADGDYVAFLDSDDIWLPGKIKAQIEFMQRAGLAATCTAYRLKRPGEPDFVSPGYATGCLGLSDLVWGCYVSPGSTLICERALFREIGPFDTSLQRLEDWDWLLRLVRFQSLGFLAEPFARIEPSTGVDVGKVGSALSVMWQKNAPEFEPRMRRQFAAALDVQRAAAFYRCGDRSAAVMPLLRSLLRVPLGNQAFAAILHNRLARTG